jgi:putative hydrolase of the HAD superfamily
MTTARPYDAVLCDIDGVLRHWPTTSHIESSQGLPTGALAAAAFAPARLHPAITGEITDEQWRSAVAADLAEICGSPDRAHDAVTAWSHLVAGVDHEVVALLAKARTVATVALVSNATTRLERDLAQQGLGDVADVIVNTSRIGVMKPDARVYVTAAAQAGTAVHRCLFIDDTAANVAAAREVGMTALHYRQIEDLRRVLAPLLSTAQHQMHSTRDSLGRSESSSTRRHHYICSRTVSTRWRTHSMWAGTSHAMADALLTQITHPEAACTKWV